MRDKPFVSVVVATYNRRQLLQGLLDSLTRQLYPKDMYEVVVVDDGSTDDTKEFLKEYEKKTPLRFKWLTQENRGVSAASNLGLRNSRGEIIFFTGDDCIAEESWIKRIVDTFTEDRVGGVGGKVTSRKPETIVQKYVEENDLLSQKKFKSMNFLLSGNVAYRRKVLDKINGFDEFFKACVDVDLSLMTQFVGYEIRYNPTAIVYHNHPLTVKSLFQQQYRNHVGFAQLHKKYTKDFNPTYNIITVTYRLARGIITYPLVVLTSITTKDRKYRLCEPILHIIVMSATMLGIMKETLRGDEYPGKKIQEKLDFIEDQSTDTLIKKIKTKLVGWL